MPAPELPSNYLASLVPACAEDLSSGMAPLAANSTEFCRMIAVNLRQFAMKLFEEFTAQPRQIISRLATLADDIGDVYELSVIRNGGESSVLVELYARRRIFTEGSNEFKAKAESMGEIIPIFAASPDGQETNPSVFSRWKRHDSEFGTFTFDETPESYNITLSITPDDMDLGMNPLYPAIFMEIDFTVGDIGRAIERGQRALRLNLEEPEVIVVESDPDEGDEKVVERRAVTAVDVEVLRAAVSTLIPWAMRETGEIVNDLGEN